MYIRLPNEMQKQESRTRIYKKYQISEEQVRDFLIRK